MSFRIEVKPAAALASIEAYSFYEERREGLGIEFLDALQEFYDGLEINPFTHSYHKEPVRQGTLSKFPYVVVYEPLADHVAVYDVFMTSQDPAKKNMS